MGKKRIVLDTNILISAFGWHGKPKEIFSKVLNKEFELIISQKQIEEIKRVLNYKKFNFTSEQKIKFLEILFLEAKVVEIKNRLDVIKEDPSDNMILETAIENDVEFIISGDDHLLKLKQYENVKIVSASEFLKML